MRRSKGVVYMKTYYTYLNFFLLTWPHNFQNNTYIKTKWHKFYSLLLYCLLLVINCGWVYNFVANYNYMVVSQGVIDFVSKLNYMTLQTILVYKIVFCHESNEHFLKTFAAFDSCTNFTEKTNKCSYYVFLVAVQTLFFAQGALKLNNISKKNFHLKIIRIFSIFVSINLHVLLYHYYLSILLRLRFLNEQIRKMSFTSRNRAFRKLELISKQFLLLRQLLDGFNNIYGLHIFIILFFAFIVSLKVINGIVISIFLIRRSLNEYELILNFFIFGCVSVSCFA